MVDLGQLSHDVDLSLMLGDLLQHLLLHKLHSNDPIFAEMVALEDHSVVAFAQRFGLVDVEIIGHLLHPLHGFQWFKNNIQSNTYPNHLDNALLSQKRSNLCF